MADAPSSGSTLDKFKVYVKTQKGTILAAETVLSFIILICYAVSIYAGYMTVAICEMVFALLFFVVFSLGLDKQFQLVNWLWSDLIRAAIGALLYIITSLVCVIRGAGDGALITGGVFGLIAGLVFAYDTYSIYLQVKSTRQNTSTPAEGV